MAAWQCRCAQRSHPYDDARRLSVRDRGWWSDYRPADGKQSQRDPPVVSAGRIKVNITAPWKAACNTYCHLAQQVTPLPLPDGQDALATAVHGQYVATSVLEKKQKLSQRNYPTLVSRLILPAGRRQRQWRQCPTRPCQTRKASATIRYSRCAHVLATCDLVQPSDPMRPARVTDAHPC